ncbi:hypothetical protein F5Y17DRAFT_316880 [Xylariaceae sp. FL0594]|nr:hypothetical protein F5Y17DRAFT_316880 [Xylariaceae sp. FL0594]
MSCAIFTAPLAATYVGGRWTLGRESPTRRYLLRLGKPAQYRKCSSARFLQSDMGRKKSPAFFLSSAPAASVPRLWLVGPLLFYRNLMLCMCVLATLGCIEVDRKYLPRTLDGNRPLKVDGHLIEASSSLINRNVVPHVCNIKLSASPFLLT